MPPQVLLTGGSGYVANLIAATLIEWTDCHVVAAVRSPKALFDLEDKVARELPLAHKRDVTRRFRAACMQAISEQQLASCLREQNVSQVVHCAGSVDYNDHQALIAANVELTRIWLAAARSHGVERFLHISTAFSAGSTGHDLIRENLHPDPESELTVYTKTKRDSERLVAEAGIPFVIIRPSILIGDSSDGHYKGKSYGIYQFWKSAERLLSDRWRPHLHVVAPAQRMPLIHQDHLKRVFAAVFNHAAPNSIIHVVSEDEPLPTCRDAWNLYADVCLMPDSVTFYDSLEQVPLPLVDRRNRAFLRSIATNVAISSQRWRFETTHLRRLCGREMPRASLESLWACQQAFVADSPVLASFLRTHLRTRRAHSTCLMKSDIT
jgi:nucleoside-diphosphate-sugar epimerase